MNYIDESDDLKTVMDMINEASSSHGGSEMDMIMSLMKQVESDPKLMQSAINLGESLGINDSSMSDMFSLKEESRFEELLELMGFSLDEHEVEAFVRDEFYTGRKSFDKLIYRCFDDRIQRLYPDLADEFKQCLKAIWDRVEPEYNLFSDGLGGKIRHEALKGIEAHLVWIREIDNTGLSTYDAPRDQIEPVGEMLCMLANMVTTFNGDEVPDKQMADDTLETLPAFLEELKKRMNEISRYLQNRK